MSKPYTPNDIIICTCGKRIPKESVDYHMYSGDHNKCLKLTIDNSKLPEFIIINEDKFDICDVCEMYVHPKRHNKHNTFNCPKNGFLSLPPNYYKGRIECTCIQALVSEENYIKHLDSKSHKNKLKNYIEYMSY